MNDSFRVDNISVEDFNWSSEIVLYSSKVGIENKEMLKFSLLIPVIPSPRISLSEPSVRDLENVFIPDRFYILVFDVASNRNHGTVSSVSRITGDAYICSSFMKKTFYVTKELWPLVKGLYIAEGELAVKYTLNF